MEEEVEARVSGGEEGGGVVFGVCHGWEGWGDGSVVEVFHQCVDETVAGFGRGSGGGRGGCGLVIDFWWAEESHFLFPVMGKLKF